MTTNYLDTRIDLEGYEMLRIRDRKGNLIPFHVLLAEKALGKQLPKGAIVHHSNEIASDNRPQNLVICQNQAYHRFLHRRINAKKACGNTSWRKCPFCKKYDDPNNMYIAPRGHTAYHRVCSAKYARKYRVARPDLNNKFNIKRRLKYKNDPEYREKIKEKQRLRDAIKYEK